MPDRLFRLYQRKRIINVNVNIIAAGLLAIIVAKMPVVWVGEFIGEDRKLLITIAAGVIDMVVDVAIYYGLHWVANHWKPVRPKTEKDEAFHAKKQPAFLKDATLIQFERALLAPIYYGVAMGLMYALQRYADWSHGWAFVAGFATGILVTRVIHTVWGLWSGRLRD